MKGGREGGRERNERRLISIAIYRLANHSPCALLLALGCAEGEVEESQGNLEENLHPLKEEHVPHSQHSRPGQGSGVKYLVNHFSIPTAVLAAPPP